VDGERSSAPSPSVLCIRGAAGCQTEHGGNNTDRRRLSSIPAAASTGSAHGEEATLEGPTVHHANGVEVGVGRRQVQQAHPVQGERPSTARRCPGGSDTPLPVGRCSPSTAAPSRSARLRARPCARTTAASLTCSTLCRT
jgi:hypothetical protein